MSAIATAESLPGWLLPAGGAALDAVAALLARRHADRAGIGVAVYSAGKQVACLVSLQPPDVASVTRLLTLIRAEIPVGLARPVVLVSLLDSPRIMSIDDFRMRGVRVGHDTVAAVSRGRVALILAHVPCLMSWNSGQLGEALVRKQGARPLEVHVYPTVTIWLDSTGRELASQGGLLERRGRLDELAGLRDEIALVARYLRDQLSATDTIDYAYDAWRDQAVHVDSLARKAIAIAALVSAARWLGDDATLDRGARALAQLAASRTPVGDIHDAHLLLASAPDSGGTMIERLRGSIRSSGEFVGPGAPDQDYFPGVALAAFASRGPLTEYEYARALRYYRALFRAQPTWPALWWQLRGWSAVVQVGPSAGAEFVYELTDWALAQQLPSGAFDTWSWPVAPSFQSVCVVEGLLGAVRVARRFGERERSRRCLAAALRGLAFASTLVLDARHTDLLPHPDRAIGGVRSWHGDFVLRADAAGHYLAALTGLAELVESEELASTGLGQA